jgi:ATP-dependent protease ClpP protease subunit
MANTGQEMDRSRDMERDYFAAPQEAKDYGIIDIVISPPGHCERRESA